MNLRNTVLRAVVLDTGPLGLASNPKSSPDALGCRQWVRELTVRGVQLVVPEIADYEVRRELLRAGKTRGLANLDAMTDTLSYLPLTTDMMRRAAQFWADARLSRRQTADPHTLDGDVILAAQALALGLPDGKVVVATSNAAHLSQFIAAKAWQDIG